MTRAIWTRCLIVSLVASLLVPFLTMAVFIPSEGEQVVDFDALESRQPQNTSAAADSADATTVPTRSVHGIERITHLFANPYWIVALRKSIFVWFLSFFAATSLVSFLNVRGKRDA